MEQKPRTDETSTWFQTSSSHACSHETEIGKDELTHFPKHLRKRQRPIEEDRQRLEREWWSWNWNVNSTRSQSSSASSTTWWQPRGWQEPQERQKARTARMAEMAGVARTSTASLSRHSTWWTFSNVRGPSIIFAKQLHIRSLFFQGVSLPKYIGFIVSDGECEQCTAPRMPHTCHTHICSRLHVAQGAWVVL